MKKLIAVLLMISAFTGNSQTAEEIINKHIAAIGGKERLLALKNIRKEIKMKNQMFELQLSEVITKEGSSRNETTIQGMKNIQVFDASTKNGWYVSPMMGDTKVHKMDDEQIQKMTEEEDRLLSPLVDYKKKGHSVELLGTDDLDGDEVYKIMLTKKNGDVEYYYIDTQSFLIWKVQTKTKFRDKEYMSDAYFYNYEMKDGILSAMTMEIQNDGQVAMQMNTEKIEYNVTIDPAIFKMPEENQEQKK